MPCGLCNAIESRGDKHQPWCPLSDHPTTPDTFEFQQSIRRALPTAEVYISPEAPAMRVGVFVRYLDGKPKAVHIGKVPEGAPRGEFRRLPVYYPAWVAAHTVEEVMTLGEKTHPGQPYRTVSYWESIAHIRGHLDLLYDGDTGEPHLAHIITRAAMALDRLLASELGEV
jgi:hypothetical protein